MKRVLRFLLLATVLFVGDVYAAGKTTISISPSSKTYIVGNTFTVTVTLTSTEPIGAYDYTVQYNSSVLSLESTSAPTGGARNVGSTSNNSTSSLSYTYKFRAKQSGTANISITGASVANLTPEYMKVTTGTSTIKVMTQAQLNATYSSNNYLSDLKVEGYNLEEEFKKDKLEYTVKLKPETEKINISATKEDSKATINGVGEVNVSEGSNQIKIEVVAQNGNIRTYTINAIVEEYDPINVLVDGKKYTVVRSKKVLTFNNSLFTESKLQIGESEVPAFYNETTKTTLVALKDEEGNIGYYIYKNGEYFKFIELKLGNVDLIVLNLEELPDYKKTKISINEIEYDVLKYSDTSRFALIYGTNLHNDNTSYYVYDNLDNTLQRYDEGLLNIKKEEIKKYKTLTYVLAGTSAGIFILFILSLCLKGKKNKKTKKKKYDIEL